MSAETFASDVRVLGRSLLEWFIPFDAKLSSDIRFFFAGDLRAASDGSMPTIGTLREPDTLWPRYVSSSACAGGRRLERRRALSIRNGPMFERRRETFSATAAERGVGGGRCTGLVGLCFSATFDSADGRFVLLLLLLLVLLVVLGGASSAKELKLRSESGRLTTPLSLPFSSSSVRLPSVVAPRDLKRPGSRRLPRCVRNAVVRFCVSRGGSGRLSWKLSSVFSSTHSPSTVELQAGAEKTELSSEAGATEVESVLLSAYKCIDGSRASSRSPWPASSRHWTTFFSLPLSDGRR